MKTLKRFLLLFALPLLFIGCTPIFTSIDTPDLNTGTWAQRERVASVGDVFFDHKEGTGYGGSEPFYDNAFRFDLTVLELTDQKIGLQYSEYMKTITPGQYAPHISDWLIKQAFTKRFDYNVADKVIHFKGYEFEIISVDKGQIRYRRIK